MYVRRFKKDKFGNQDIVGMMSADDEEVGFCKMIFPAEAKGMVRTGQCIGIKAELIGKMYIQ